MIVGATGVGGGSLMTPILIMAFGIKPTLAVGTDLFYACISKSFGVFLHRTQGTVNWRIVLLLAAGSLPACGLTLLVLHNLGAEGVKFALLNKVLAMMILVTACFTLITTLLKAPAGQRLHRRDIFQHSRLREPLVIVLGAVVGVTVTLSSVGAGAIVATLLLVLYPRLPAAAIVGTDLAYAIPLTLVAGLGHLSTNHVDFRILSAMLLGSLPGIFVGTKFGSIVPDRILRPILGIALIGMSILLLIRT